MLQFFDNITLWDEDIPSNRDKFDEAVRRATLEDFIDNLPNKEKTQLGNNGIFIDGRAYVLEQGYLEKIRQGIKMIQKN